MYRMAKRNILVLGINDGHDAGAALVLPCSLLSKLRKNLRCFRNWD